jgi:hypothetical protein
MRIKLNTAEPASAIRPSNITPLTPISGHKIKPEKVHRIRFLVTVRIAPLYAFPTDNKILDAVI